MTTNISEIVKIGMCLGCGACVVACDFNAIKMHYNKSIGNYQPIISNNDCRSCSNCLDICFGNTLDYKLSNNISKEIRSSIGNIVKTYIGYSNDKELRYKASSGGIVSTILKFLLDKKLIDGVIVAKTNSGTVPLTKSIIIHDNFGILETMGSKYVPNLLTFALKNLKKNKSYALVGLPCQIYSIEKLIEKKKIEGNITITIGLFCGGFFNYNGIKYLMKKYNIKKNPIKSINFRGNGWPGKMKLVTKSDFLEVPYLEYWPVIQPWFSPRRCEVCLSGFNKNSDISCGDAWLPEVMKKDKIGTSIIITRTNKGNLLIDNLISENYIKTKKVNPKLIIRSQASMVNFKHLSLYTRIKILNLLKRKLLLSKKNYRKKYNFNIKSIIDEIILQVGKFLAKNEKTWNLFTIFIRLNKKNFEFYRFCKKIL